MTSRAANIVYEVESNPNWTACQWCTERPSRLFAFLMPATTVRICPACLDRLVAIVFDAVGDNRTDPARPDAGRPLGSGG